MNKDWIWRAIANTILGLMVALALVFMVSKLPLAGNYMILTVLSGSMEPQIRTGAVVVIKPMAEYRAGDIVTFTNAGDDKVPVTHRIIDIGGDGGRAAFTTKGDANEEADIQQVSEGQIMGKVLFSVPFAGYVLEFLRQPLGFVLVIVIPAAAIIIDEIIKIAKQLRSQTNGNSLKGPGPG